MNDVAKFIFEGLHPHFMASLFTLLAGIYFFKYFCSQTPAHGLGRRYYLLKSFLWGLFGMVWVAFPYTNLVLARSLLRLMLAIVVLVEISYNMLYIFDAIRNAYRWIFLE